MLTEKEEIDGFNTDDEDIEQSEKIDDSGTIIKVFLNSLINEVVENKLRNLFFRFHGLICDIKKDVIFLDNGVLTHFVIPPHFVIPATLCNPTSHTL